MSATIKNTRKYGKIITNTKKKTETKVVPQRQGRTIPPRHFNVRSTAKSQRVRHKNERATYFTVVSEILICQICKNTAIPYFLRYLTLLSSVAVGRTRLVFRDRTPRKKSMHFMNGCRGETDLDYSLSLRVICS